MASQVTIMAVETQVMDLDTRVTAVEGAAGAGAGVDAATIQALQDTDTDFETRISALEALDVPTSIANLQTSIITNCNKIKEVTDITDGINSNTC